MRIVLISGVVFTLLSPPLVHNSLAQNPDAHAGGAAEIGWRAFTSSPTREQYAKFEEYKSLPEGALLRELRWWLAPGSGFRTLTFSGHNVGERDQAVSLRANQPGALDLMLTWDRIPHVFSTNARSLGSQISPDVFTLPNPRPDTSLWNRTAPLLPVIGTRWNAARAALSISNAERWDFKTEYTRLDKGGERPIGMAFGSPGSNLREILEPIDQDVHDLRVTQSFSSAKAQFVASYNLSLFRNAFESVTSDNPLITTDLPTGGAARGRMSLAPDNVAHTASLNGAVNFPWRTRANVALSHAWWKQNAAFIPMTVNSAITDARIASMPASLAGVAGTSSFSMSATSRPMSALGVSARFRTFSYRDETELDSVPVLIVNDRSISNAAERERFPFTKKNADFSMSWHNNASPVTITLAYAWDFWARNQATRNVYRTSEKAPRIGLDLGALSWLDLHATYSTAKRRAQDPYLQNTPADLPEHRRFDQADRDRDRLNTLALISPVDGITLSVSWSRGHDDYPHSSYGLQKDRSTAIGGDIFWTPSDRFTVGAGYTRETFLTTLRSRYRVTGQLDNLSYDWVSNTRDVVATTNANLNIILIPERLQAGGRYDLSDARYRMATYNPITPTGGTAAQNAAATASDLPEVTQRFRPMTFFLSYRYSDDWSADVNYSVERYEQNDFRTLDQLPAEGNGIFLGNDLRNYDARYLTFSISYRLGVKRAPRSAI